MLVACVDPTEEIARSDSSTPHMKHAPQNYPTVQLNIHDDNFKRLAATAPELSTPCFILVDEEKLRWVPGRLSDDAMFSFIEGGNNSMKQLSINLDSLEKFGIALKCSDTSSASLPDHIPPEQEYHESLEIGNLEQQCHLSIRLMDATVVKFEFNDSLSLLDVKHWLQQQKYIPRTPEDDEIISSYVQTGYLEKFRYAFFYPAKRCTFSEPQELLRLRDLGLTSRVSLILRPHYDPTRKPEEIEKELKTSWSQTTSRLRNILQAFYQFLDYGVDEAQRDLQDFTDGFDHKEYGAPQFLSTAPTTGLLVNITPGYNLQNTAKSEEFNLDYSFVHSATRAGTPSLQMTESNIRKED